MRLTPGDRHAASEVGPGLFGQVFLERGTGHPGDLLGQKPGSLPWDCFPFPGLIGKGIPLMQ